MQVSEQSIYTAATVMGFHWCGQIPSYVMSPDVSVTYLNCQTGYDIMEGINPWSLYDKIPVKTIIAAGVNFMFCKRERKIQRAREREK